MIDVAKAYLEGLVDNSTARVPLQIAVGVTRDYVGLYALANDGTLWAIENPFRFGGQWVALPRLPSKTEHPGYPPEETA